VARLERWLCRRYAWARRAALREPPLASLPEAQAAPDAPVLVVGLGAVGRALAQGLRQQGLGVVGIDSSAERVAALREAGGLAVCGDARDPRVLVQAHLQRARLLVLTPADAPLAQQVGQQARILRPELPLLLRAASDEEAERAREAGTTALAPAEAWSGALLRRCQALLGGSATPH
jgi:CPA2 family monovalent cation:H+ antiporter-2